jgi:hypothetical protein
MCGIERGLEAVPVEFRQLRLVDTEVERGQYDFGREW